MKFTQIIFAVLLLAFSQCALAELVIHSLESFTKPHTLYSAEDLYGNTFNTHYKKIHVLEPLAKDTGWIWVRMIISPDSDSYEGNFILNYNFTKRFKIHYKNEKGVLMASNEYGNIHPFPKNSLYHNLVVPLRLKQPYDTILVQYQAIDSLVSAPAHVGMIYLINHRQLQNLSIQTFFYLGLLLGIIGFVLVFTFLIYLRTRVVTYLYYFLYLSQAALFLLTINNYTLKMLFSVFTLSYWRLLDVYALCFSCMTIFLILYSTSFLNLKMHHNYWHRFLVFMAICKAIFYILGVLANPIMHRLFPEPYSLFNSFWHAPIFDTLFLLPAFLAGIYRVVKGDHFARFYVLAFGFLFAAFIIHATGMSTEFSLIRQSQIGFYSNAFFDFMVFEIIFFSLSLAERFRLERRQKEKAMQMAIDQLRENAAIKEQINAALETKVRERTQLLMEKNKEIEQLNRMLEQHNLKLKADVKDLAKARVTRRPVALEEFKRTYPDETACLNYLVELKWGAGFVCRKCKNKNYIDGKTPLSRRCNHCWYEESPTMGTIFHKLKFPIEKAFYLLYLVTNHPKISIEELSRLIDISERTCWSYKNKILTSMKRIQNDNKTETSWSDIILNASFSKDM